MFGLVSARDAAVMVMCLVTIVVVFIGAYAMGHWTVEAYARWRASRQRERELGLLKSLGRVYDRGRKGQ
jgi:hypothetical protein